MQTKKYILSHLLLAICYGLTFLIAIPTLAQTTTGKRQLFTENGRTMSNGITVHFKLPLFNLPVGKQTAQLSDFKVGFEPIKQYFSDLERQHEEITFYKLIPSAKWGDVWRKHVRTAELVRVTDMSQLYSIEFKKAVAVDEIITELESMEDVMYAHPPVQVLALNEPNDDCYNDVTPCVTLPSYSDQWNLKKVDAEKAWDLTTGDPDIIVAVVDPGNFTTTHPDLQNKFILSSNTNTQGTPGTAHSTAVSGVVAAETDNSVGIASLGWNIRIKPFAFNDTGIPGSVEMWLDSTAVDSEVQIINCSFIVREGGGGCSEDYTSIRSVIQKAIAMGKIVIAATGNTPLGGGCEFPFAHFLLIILVLLE